MHCAYLALQVASQCWREKCEKKIGSCSAVYFFYRHLLGIDRPWNRCILFFVGKELRAGKKKQRGGVVSLQCRRFLRARKCFCSWKLHDGGYNNTNKTRTRFRPPIGVFPALLLRAALHYPNAWNGLCQHGPRGLGLLKSHYGSWSTRRHD